MARPKNRLQISTEYALAFFLVTALEGLPLPMARIVARLTTRVLDRTLPKLRGVARTNLSFAFPELSHGEREQIIDGVFQSLARLLVAFGRFPRLNQSNISDWIIYEGLEHYLEAKRSGRGILIATAHLGNWELSAFAHALMTEPMNVMVRPLDNPRVDSLVEKRRQLSGNRLIVKKDAARTVLKALRNNEAVGILIDQNTSASEGIFVDFFGKRACASSAFIKLAQHSGAAVVPGFAFWDETKQKYVLRFYTPLAVTDNEAADTQRLHHFIEGEIRRYPDQWMWIHRRWKTRPFGEPDLY